MKDCLLSIVIVFYNGKREAERTLYTLSPKYQSVDKELYKVISNSQYDYSNCI